MNTQSKWLSKLAKLRVNRSQGLAPHKPLLLLVVLEMLEQGDLASPILKLTPELAYRFSQFGTVVAHRRTQRMDIRLPFFHLSSDSVWSAFTKEGSEALDPKATKYVQIDSDFYTLAQTADFRSQARLVLIRTYFEPAEQVALATLVNVPIEDLSTEFVAVKEGDASYQTGRDVRFRLDIVAAYGYTCALTSYRVTTIGGSSIIDAAHIHQFSESRNNDPKNGIALCKNAHWMFDQGLWSLDDNYRVLVAHDAFDEDSAGQRPLRDFEGMRVSLPVNSNLWPDPQHLAWHREHKFCA
ncbi:MAG: HNH endonuclease [Planctomycetota bacterium]